MQPYNLRESTVRVLLPLKIGWSSRAMPPRHLSLRHAPSISKGPSVERFTHAVQAGGSAWALRPWQARRRRRRPSLAHHRRTWMAALRLRHHPACPRHPFARLRRHHRYRVSASRAEPTHAKQAKQAAPTLLRARAREYALARAPVRTAGMRTAGMRTACRRRAAGGRQACGRRRVADGVWQAADRHAACAPSSAGCMSAKYCSRSARAAALASSSSFIFFCISSPRSCKGTHRPHVGTRARRQGAAPRRGATTRRQGAARGRTFARSSNALSSSSRSASFSLSETSRAAASSGCHGDDGDDKLGAHVGPRRRGAAAPW